MPYLNTKKMDDQQIQNQNYYTNIWTYDINNEVNDPRPTIPITNAMNIEHYDLQFDFVIQSYDGSNKKSQFQKMKNSQNHHIPW